MQTWATIFFSVPSGHKSEYSQTSQPSGAVWVQAVKVGDYRPTVSCWASYDYFKVGFFGKERRSLQRVQYEAFLWREVQRKGWDNRTFLVESIHFWTIFMSFRIVEFASKSDMKNALKKCDDMEVGGRRIRVTEERGSCFRSASCSHFRTPAIGSACSRSWTGTWPTSMNCRTSSSSRKKTRREPGPTHLRLTTQAPGLVTLALIRVRQWAATTLHRRGIPITNIDL